MRSLKLKKSSRGIASLPLVLLMGGIIIEITIAGAFVFYYINSNVYGTKLAGQAAAIARASVDDAILRVILNPNCGNDVTCPNTTSTLTLGSATAEVTICKDTCGGIGITQVTALGRSSAKRHRVIAILNVSTTMPFVTVASITDIPE